MPWGRGGIGSTKHGKSGHSGPSPRAKFHRALDASSEKLLRIAHECQRHTGEQGSNVFPSDRHCSIRFPVLPSRLGAMRSLS
jgi:hypothetical protein